MSEVTVSKDVFKYLFDKSSVPLAGHIFTGNCKCKDCEALRAFPIEEYEDYAWVINELNGRRNMQVNPMPRELFVITKEALKGKKVPLKI